MTASLSPGVDSLVLTVKTPLDTDNATPRDDLVGLKVWYSLTDGTFDPSAGQGTLVYDGRGLSVTIANLQARTPYHIKYALISEIEPDNYVISQAITGTPIYSSQTKDLTPPPTPSTISISAAISNVFISQEYPAYTQGRGHLKTHVYAIEETANTAPAYLVFANAVKVAEFTGTSYAYATNPGTKLHIWLKWETNDNVLSVVPSGGTGGHIITTGQDVTKLLSVLDSQLTESQLYNTLRARINLIDAAANVAGSVNARISTETENRTTATTALAQQITTLSTTVGQNTSAISSEISTRADQTGALFAQYTIKVDTNGYVSGFGLANTARDGVATSEFDIIADRFSIAPVQTDGNAANNSPFYHRNTTQTVNGVEIPPGTYIKTAFIADATITSAKIASLSADKITAGTMSAKRISTADAFVDNKLQSNDGKFIIDFANKTISISV